jgi:hypothetical protein
MASLYSLATYQIGQGPDARTLQNKMFVVTVFRLLLRGGLAILTAFSIEWRKKRVHLKNKEQFALAGLWDV